mmetsp:Transcript_6315/g.14022  ORF Transcript_6315/g.14022 Transcript_6315/m.14022 type:complete len:702 (-) Transcript_6315:60-2165(-)
MVGPISVAFILAFTVYGCDCFSTSPPSMKSPPNPSLVPRLTLEEYLASPITKKPVLIKDIASPDEIESLADQLIGTLGEEIVQMQRKVKEETNYTTTTEIYDVSLQESIDYMMDSNHFDSYFTFCEGLLPSSPSETMQTLAVKLEKIRDAPYHDQENWFEYFPTSIKPTDAIIMAGTGATSTLHRDPFEWTGTSLCLEGTKIWRFILPPEGGVKLVDEALRSYRLDSIAWENQQNDEKPIVLSAGWQSDMTLYESISDDFPDAFEWMQLEEEDSKKFQRENENAGVNATCLRPCAALDNIHGSSKPQFVTAIQQTGDLLLIPAHCWHQTYAPVPSVAVASQRCGAKVDAASVIGHILKLTRSEEEANIPDILKRDEYEEGTGEDVVKKLLKFVLRPQVRLQTECITLSSGLSLSYVESLGHDASDSPTTLFIHGLDSSSQTWRGVQQALKTPSIAIDCRGCGHSDLGDEESFSPDALVEDVKSLVKTNRLLKGKKIVLVGHSMGGRIAMMYAAKYPEDVSALVVEDMDIMRRSVESNFIQSFDERKAIAFDRSHTSLESVKEAFAEIGYPTDMLDKWIGEGRIEKKESGEYWSGVNPAFRALCYRTVFDSYCGTDAWGEIVKHTTKEGEYKHNAKIYLMVAGICSVCNEDSLQEMRESMSGNEGLLSMTTYEEGTHSIHNTARNEFMNDLEAIITNAKVEQ